MSVAFRALMRTLLAGVALLSIVRTASAVPITYTEKIEDLNYGSFFDMTDFSRDLTRTRSFGDATSSEVVTDDATIVSENALTDNWGFSTFLPFGWRHVFAPLYPVNSFIQAKLTLDVIGVESDLPDIVFVGFFPIGVLTAGGMDTQSTSVFSTAGWPDPDALISFVLSGGQADFFVVPLLFDFMSIRSSTLEVTYDTTSLTIAEVPEPATAMLLLTGLAVFGGRRLARRLPVRVS
jgi:hypothetical protein